MRKREAFYLRLYHGHIVKRHRDVAFCLTVVLSGLLQPAMKSVCMGSGNINAQQMIPNENSQ